MSRVTHSEPGLPIYGSKTNMAVHNIRSLSGSELQFI